MKARPLPLDPEQRRDPNNRITVNEHLEIPGYRGVYLIGDGALFINNGIPLPPTASVAVQEAKYIAQNILLHSQKKEPPPFRFRYRGDMASLGFMFGVAEVYGRQFKGLPAWIIWKAFQAGNAPTGEEQVSNCGRLADHPSFQKRHVKTDIKWRVKILSGQGPIETNGKGQSFEDGFLSEGKEMCVRRSMSLSLGVPMHPF